MTFGDSLFLSLKSKNSVLKIKIRYTFYLEMYAIKDKIHILQQHVVINRWFVIVSDITWV